MNENLRTGVYCITNSLNGKRYVGSAARSFRTRWNAHRHHLRRGTHHCAHLQAAWKNDGESAFEFSILETCSPKECVALEQTFIDLHKSADRLHGYNADPKAGHSLGRKASVETRAKLRAAHLGRKRSPSHCVSIGNGHRGRKCSSESLALMRASQSSPEARERQRQIAIRGWALRRWIKPILTAA
jgi:group I intron endonuclease